MKELICKNAWFKSNSNLKFWLFWQQPAALCKNAAFSNFAPSKSMVHTSKPVCLHFSHCPTYSY